VDTLRHLRELIKRLSIAWRYLIRNLTSVIVLSQERPLINVTGVVRHYLPGNSIVRDPIWGAGIQCPRGWLLYIWHHEHAVASRQFITACGNPSRWQACKHVLGMAQRAAGPPHLDSSSARAGSWCSRCALSRAQMHRRDRKARLGWAGFGRGADHRLAPRGLQLGRRGPH
jgi:hypothetical protein